MQILRLMIGKKLGVCHCNLGFEHADDGACFDADECAVESSCPDNSEGILCQSVILCHVRCSSRSSVDDGVTDDSW